MGAIQTKVKSIKNRKKQKNKENVDILKKFETTAIPLRIPLNTIATLMTCPRTDDNADFFHQHHFIVKTIWSSNFSSPIKDKLIDGEAKVLDVSCVAGTFLLDLSNEYQNSEFIGVDEDKLFPTEIKPKNLEFITANLLDGLPFEENHFDFVHLNILETFYALDHWNYIVKELIRVTKPGGYIEIQGFDHSEEYIGPKFMRYVKGVLLVETNGIYVRPRNHIKSLFTKHLETTNLEVKTVSISKNGGEFGKLIVHHVTTYFKAVAGVLVNLMNISVKDFEQGWDEEVLKEFEEFDTRLNAYRLWGMKKE